MTRSETASEPETSDIRGVTVIDLVDPDAEALEEVGERFSIHELAIEDAVKAHQRPKLERYGDDLLLVLKSARYDDEAEHVEFGEILLLFADDFVVIIRHDRADSFDLQSDRAPYAGQREGAGILLHRILDQVVDDYAPVISGFEIDVEEVEETVFSSEDAYPTERIYRLKRELLAFLHNTRPLVEPVAKLQEEGVAGMEGMMEYFRDVEDHLRRVVDRADRASELVSEVLDANLTQVSLRQNQDMRRISAWAAIFLLPTVLAGIWGMNFENMPELDWTYGYPMAIGVMLLSTAFIYWLLRRSGWL